MLRYGLIGSPLGDLLLVGNGDHLHRLVFPTSKRGQKIAANWQEDPRSFSSAKAQLDAYFAKELQMFDLPLAPSGSPFQLQVWDLLSKIPYGETRSYGALARDLGSSGASRAVGLANGANPLPIIRPCHRVIGQNGSLTGFGAGMAAKTFLLDLEGALPASARQMTLF